MPSKDKLNNPEWLRWLDKHDMTIVVCPYSDSGYFRQQIIQPLLNKDGFLSKEHIGVEYQRDGINYRVFDYFAFGI